MKKKTAVLVHLNGIDGVTPLVGGYLKAYALADPVVAASWEVELYSASCKVSASHVIRHLVRRAPDLVGFSVYTWNAGLVQRLVPALRGLLPNTRFLLGGVEVMNVGPRYVERTWDNVAVCNGEGERSFRDLLLQLGEARPDLERVGGISFPRDGEWHTTAGQPRIQDLTELPSPWLSGAFDDEPRWNVALFETNRGCPFACEFCFWGGAIGQKIYQQDLERLKDEITFIAKRGVTTISLCDANFGILPRDVELARHLVAAGKENRGLNRVVFNSSKVRPDRVAEISEIFSEAELLTRHVFSLQTLNEKTLKIAKRTGLEREPYREIQRQLNAKRMSSIIEILWPMPGETLDTFKDGVDELCEAGAQGFLIFPLIWLNNTGYQDKTEEFGVITLPEDDASSGGRIVVKTNDVPFEDYLDGLQFALAVYLLHDCRGLYAAMQLMNALGVARFRDVFDAFARYMNTEAAGPAAELWRTHLEAFEDMAKYNVRGEIGDAVLNGNREDFDRVMQDFVARHPAWTAGEHGDLIAEAVEYDLLCRPYVFLQTPFALGVEPERIELVETRPRVRRVRAHYPLPRLIDKLRTGQALPPEDLMRGEVPIEINHKTNQIFLMPGRTENEHYWSLTLAVQEIARIEPRCRVEPLAEMATILGH